MNHIKMFNDFYCQKVLPLVYDNSLSYYEVLLKLQHTINEVIKNQNVIIDYFINFKEYVDTKIEEYTKDKLDEWLADGTMDELVNVTKYNELKAELELQIADTNEKLQTLNAKFSLHEKYQKEVFINAKEHGLILDGVTDMTDTLQTILNTYKDSVIYIPDGYCLLGKINLNEGQRIICDSEIITLPALKSPIFNGIGTDECELQFNKKALGNDNDLTSFIKLENSSDCIIICKHVKGFLNKGIDISEGCENNLITNSYVEGSLGTHGAGISLLGFNNKNNTVERCQCVNNRIGIALNGGNYNECNNNYLNDNGMGIALDGIVTASGDGTRFSKIQNNVILKCNSTLYSSIYIGNGSSYNIVTDNIILDSIRTGVRFSAGPDYQCKGNKIEDNIIITADNGIEMSYSPENSFKNNLIKTCKRGIASLYSDYCEYEHNTIDGSITVGILLQSGNNTVTGNKIKNSKVGLQIAYGGSAPDYNFITLNNFKNNDSNLVNAGLNKISNNNGYATSSRGIATGITNGGKIPHGLVKNPSVAPYGSITLLSKDGATPNGLYASVDATDITVFFEGENLCNFYWSAQSGLE